MNNKTNFGIIGMGVMGRSLAKNIAGNGFSLSIYNRLTEAEKHVIPNFLKETESLDIQGFTEIKSFIGSLASPRKILLMVNAGTAVDSVIEQLLPSLEKGDLIIDGGNSHYQDTQRRCAQLEQISIQYLGVGVSGGEQGALYGPSMMVGGNIKAYGLVQPIFEPIA